MDKVRVGIIGAGFVANIHALGLHHVPNAEIVAVAGKGSGKAAEFAALHRIPHAYEDYRELLDRKDIDAITVAVPNYLHEEVVVAAAAAWEVSRNAEASLSTLPPTGVPHSWQT